MPPGIISISSKRPVKKKFTFEDFNGLAIERDYENLPSLYRSIKLDNPSFTLEEGKLNTLGLQLVTRPNKSRYGIAILHLAVLIYPESANLFDSLAEGYLFLDDKKNAIENFEKSLELNPANENAINRLKQLKG